MTEPPAKRSVRDAEPTVSLRRRATGATRDWSTARGRLRVESRSRDVLLFEAVGHLEVDLFGPFRECVETVLASGRPHLFWDGENLTGCDSDFRLRFGTYCVEVRARVGSMHVYTPYRLAAMGVLLDVWRGGAFQRKRTRGELWAALEAQMARSAEP